MAKKSIEERLAHLEVQRQTLRARLGKQERSKDTRRKVLLGALVLHRLDEDNREFDKTMKEWLQRELPGFLTREDDKALFPDLLAASSAKRPATTPGAPESGPVDLLTPPTTGA